MKQLFSLSFLLLLLCSSTNLFAHEDKSKRPSTCDTLTISTKDLNSVIHYSQPTINGNTMCKDIVTYGKVWHTGAKEATTSTVNRYEKIESKTSKNGKSSMFTIPGEN